VKTKVVPQMSSEVTGLADTQYISIAMKDIDARSFWQTVDQRGIQVRRKHGSRQQRRNGICYHLLRMIAMDGTPKLPEKLRIRERTMARLCLQAVPLHEGIEIMM